MTMSLSWVRQAARAKVACDWGLDLSPGPQHDAAPSRPRQGGLLDGAVAGGVGLAAWPESMRLIGCF